MTISRRSFVAGTLATGLLTSACVPEIPDVTLPPGTQLQYGPGNRFEAMLRQIEAEADGTLGVEIFDTATGQSVGIGRNRRFGMCSVFKLSLAAKILQRHATGEDSADRRVTWGEEDMVGYFPFIADRMKEGATLRELAEIAVIRSDSSASNILLREIGGPPALTAFWRSIGDDVTRLDRYEFEVNNVPEAEYRDTTTPAAMARTVAELTYGSPLPERERAILRQWMIDTVTGTNRVRAGIDQDLIAGDKTGTSLWPEIDSIYADVGFVEAPDGDDDWKPGPITFAAFFRAREQHETIEPGAEAALARVGEVITAFTEKPDDWPF